MTSKDEAHLGRILVRQVEFVAAIYRQVGFDFPTEYDFGFRTSLNRLDQRVHGFLRLWLRIDEVLLEFSIPEPVEASMNAVDAFREGMETAAGQLVKRYVEAHPELATRKDVARGLGVAMENRAASPLVVDKLVENAAVTAKSARYTEVR